MSDTKIERGREKVGGGETSIKKKKNEYYKARFACVRYTNDRTLLNGRDVSYAIRAQLKCLLFRLTSSFYLKNESNE